MSAIPTIGFFAPLPLPMMIPFMGIQSAVMAEQFGTMFQYGKRRISAMSNEEFNALTPQMLQERMTRQLEGMIPEMGRQIQAMQPLIKLILSEFGAYISQAGDLVTHTLLGPDAHLIKHDDGLLSQADWEKEQQAHLAGTHYGHTPPASITTTTPTTSISVTDTPTITESVSTATEGWPDSAKQFLAMGKDVKFLENFWTTHASLTKLPEAHIRIATVKMWYEASIDPIKYARRVVTNYEMQEVKYSASSLSIRWTIYYYDS